MKLEWMVKMRVVGAFVVAQCAVSLVAAPVRRAMLPVSPWADTEISTNVASNASS